MTTPATPTKGFKHKLSDLRYWIIRYTDGSVVKYIYQDPPPEPASGTALVRAPGSTSIYTSYSQTAKHSMSQWCDHDVTDNHIIYAADDGSLTLTVADHWGAVEAYRGQNKNGSTPDIIIDCGGVVYPITQSQGRFLTGDEALAAPLRQFVTAPDLLSPPPSTRVLKINWEDRKAPNLHPAFWPALEPMLQGNVVINCQGGHGRSGSAFAALMMVLVPDYTPLDAIIHLRALHCPRAIESKEQHLYLNEVGAYLNREQNALQAETIGNFKAAFEASTKEEAQRMIAWKKIQEAVAAKAVVQ